MSARLRFNFFDVYKNRLQDDVDILFQHTVLKKSFEVSRQDASKPVNVGGIDARQGGRYALWIYPRKHRSVFRIVQVKDEPDKNEVDFVLPVRPERVLDPVFPVYKDLPKDLKTVLVHSSVETSPGSKGAALYDSLDDPRKASLLNLYWKMKNTLFANGRDVFSYVGGLTRLRSDRFFARAEKDLRDEVKSSIASKLFHEVPAGMHTPPDQYSLADSFKTLDNYGNLQLTFFSSPTQDFIIDTDIDDAQGIGHIFQVTEHLLTKNETNPYDIHEILVYHQQIDPGYKLPVA